MTEILERRLEESHRGPLVDDLVRGALETEALQGIPPAALRLAFTSESDAPDLDPEEHVDRALARLGISVTNDGLFLVGEREELLHQLAEQAQTWSSSARLSELHSATLVGMWTHALRDRAAPGTTWRDDVAFTKAMMEIAEDLRLTVWREDSVDCAQAADAVVAATRRILGATLRSPPHRWSYQPGMAPRVGDTVDHPRFGALAVVRVHDAAFDGRDAEGVERRLAFPRSR